MKMVALILAAVLLGGCWLGPANFVTMGLGGAGELSKASTRNPNEGPIVKPRYCRTMANGDIICPTDQNPQSSE